MGYAIAKKRVARTLFNQIMSGTESLSTPRLETGRYTSVVVTIQCLEAPVSPISGAVGGAQVGSTELNESAVYASRCSSGNFALNSASLNKTNAFWFLDKSSSVTPQATSIPTLSANLIDNDPSVAPLLGAFRAMMPFSLLNPAGVPLDTTNFSADRLMPTVIGPFMIFSVSTQVLGQFIPPLLIRVIGIS